MMKTYQMMGVEQSAARYQATRHNRRHTCDQIGMCQCEGLTSQPGHVCEAEEPSTTPFDKMADAILVAVVSGLTLGVSIGIGNWFYFGLMAV